MTKGAFGETPQKGQQQQKKERQAAKKRCHEIGKRAG